MAKFRSLAPRKFRSPVLKGFIVFFGILFLVTGLLALILSFVFFWEASCDSCSGVQCSSSGGLVGQKDMDWSFLILDVYFIVAVIIGPILLASGNNMTTKRSYLRAYPYAAFCPNCDTLCDKRNGTCANCGTDIDPEGMFKHAQVNPNYTYSSNPYSNYRPSNPAPIDLPKDKEDDGDLQK